MKTRIASDGYDIVIARNQLDGLVEAMDGMRPRSGIHILVDSNTRSSCLPMLLKACPSLCNAEIMETPTGESNKDLSSIQKIVSGLLEAGADRDSLLINLGGGVVSDAGGFAAAVFMRGIRFIQVPTTLLAMVDASVGGKTGVNFGQLKNLIGTFSRPELVWIDPAFLETLPVRELRSGLAEVVKHSIIANVPPVDELPDPQNLIATDWSSLIESSVRYKNDVVSQDFKDLNHRKVLNFGHTVGHALEGYSLVCDEHPLLHGEAVALGMMVELVLSSRCCGYPDKSMIRYIRLIRQHFPELPVPEFDDRLVLFLNGDKKKSSGLLNCVLLGPSGNPLVDQVVTVDEIAHAMQLLKDAMAVLS